MRQHGFIAIPELPLWMWLAIALGFSVIFGIVQTNRLKAEKAEHKAFVKITKSLGEEAAKKAAKQTADDKKAKEKADEKNRFDTTALLADIQRLRNNHTRRGYVPVAPAGSSRPELACFDRAELDGALGRFLTGVIDLTGEGAKATVDLNAAKAWAQR